MGRGSHAETLTVGSRLMQRTVDATGDNETLIGGAATPVTLPAGTAVSSWVKTDNDTGVATLAEGHGLTDGIYDVFWAAGIRYGMDGTVVGNDLTLDGGSGDNLPASATEDMVVAEQYQVNVSLDGDLAVMVGVEASVRAHVDFQDADGDSIRAVELIADEPDMWDNEMDTNVYTGDPITVAMVGNGEASAGTLEIIILQDSTPS